MKNVQVIWGYLFVFSILQAIALVLHMFIQMFNPLLISLFLLIIFLYFYQILPLEHSNYLLGFRIEWRNQDFHWIV